MRSPAAPFLLSFVAVLALPARADAQATPPPAKPGTVFSIVGEVAPKWVTQRPFDYADPTDATAVSLTFKAKREIANAFKLEVSLGPKATLDANHDDPDEEGSAFGLGAKVTVPAKFGIALVGSAALDKKFKHFFEEANGSKRILSTGLEYGYDIPWAAKSKLSASALYGVADSTGGASDQDFASAGATLETPLWWFAKLSLGGTAARRWYHHDNATLGFKERRTELGASAGLNFAAAVVKLTHGDPNNPWIRKLQGGFDFFKRKSNVPDSRIKTFSPSLTLSVGHDF